jgi:hypothetical protein
MIHVIGPKDPRQKGAILTVSISKTWSRGLSPFYLGPIPCYDNQVSKNMENAWQYSKVYSHHLDNDGNPSPNYFAWRDTGWSSDRADRYPAGKGAIPAYSYWNGEKLTYVQARFKIYAPCYVKSVVQSEAFKQLQDLHKQQEDLWLWDFDGYNHRASGKTSYKQVFDDPNRKAGHAFLLAALLEKEITLDGQFLEKDNNATAL